MGNSGNEKNTNDSNNANHTNKTNRNYKIIFIGVTMIIKTMMIVFEEESYMKKNMKKCEIVELTRFHFKNTKLFSTDIENLNFIWYFISNTISNLFFN